MDGQGLSLVFKDRKLLHLFVECVHRNCDSFYLCLFSRKPGGNSCLLRVFYVPDMNLERFNLNRSLKCSTSQDCKVNATWSLPLRRSWFCGQDRGVNLQFSISVIRAMGSQCRDKKSHWKLREFPGGPVVRTLCSHCQSSIPGQGTEIL